MQRTQAGGYGYGRTATHHAGDVEAWIANSLATILAGIAVAAGVIGLFVAFGYFSSSTNHFDDGMVWMVGGLILGLCANVFRREHHVTDNSDLIETLSYQPPRAEPMVDERDRGVRPRMRE